MLNIGVNPWLWETPSYFVTSAFTLVTVPSYKSYMVIKEKETLLNHLPPGLWSSGSYLLKKGFDLVVRATGMMHSTNRCFESCYKQKLGM